jgi:ATP-dependent protease ClpP protease subunit
VKLLKVIGWICGILLFWGYFQLPSGSGNVAARQTLSIKEEPDRVVLGWSGPVQEPMSERVAAALDRYKADRRRLVLILNSPGGSIEHGRRVVAAIHSRDRALDTFVQKAGVCASMCVPIFLAGTERMADPEALFMFHETSLTSSARETMKESVRENVRENNKRQQIPASEEAAFSETVNAIEAQVTDELFRNDIGIRGVNKAWLAMMRKKIPGRDVWVSGQQLVDERSGIVDRLVGTPAR